MHNVCLSTMFGERYEGLRIAITDAAMRDLMKSGKTIYDVVKILEEGYDAPRKRKEGTVERWFDKGSKTFNVVIARDYDDVMKEDCWVLIHFGKFSRRRKL